MEDNAQKNKRIAKNTILLYLRTLATMLISLFTSRIILNVLGVDDYGIYNVVGGTISMFSIFSGSLSGAISRFITFGLGEGDLDKLKRTFVTSVNIQLGISAVIFIVAEVAGLWMLNSKLNIPPDRLYAAHWVLQFSILSFVFGLISVPYNACIIAHEHMKVFAYMGILEVVLKLAFVVALYFSPFDKLIVYSFCLFLISLVLRIIYGVYCKRHFEECEYKFAIDRRLLKSMTSYAWWGFFGNTAYMFNTQGVNILINLFFGVALNAARGVVGQVEGAVMQFVNNFTTAISPQITKSYAAGDKDYMFSLICRGAKFQIFLMLFFIIPIEFEADSILQLWLGVVPESAAVFLRLSLITTAITLLGNTGFTSVTATGNIRNYQISVTIVGCLVFPLTWVAYKLGAPALATYIIYAIVYIAVNWVRLLFMRQLLGFPISMFLNKTVLPMLAVTVSAVIIPAVVFFNMEASLLRIIVVTIVSFASTAVCIYFLGLAKGERELILSKIKAKVNHFK